MLKHNYNSYEKQKEAHVQFIKEFSQLKKEFDANGVTSHLTIQIQNKVCNWLRNHIGDEDKKIGVFLKVQGQPSHAAV